jgi:hypothetical protein
VGVEPEIDDVADAQGSDVGELRLGRPAGCRDRSSSDRSARQAAPGDPVHPVGMIEFV